MKNINKKKIYNIVVGALIITACVLLYGTGSYYSVYVICTAAGLFSLWISCNDPMPLKNDLVSASLIACLFAVLIPLANYDLLYPITKNLLKALFIALGSGLNASSIYLCCIHHLPLKTDKPSFNPKKTFLFTFLLIAAIDLLFLYLFYYPGNVWSDSINQFMQIMSGKYTNHHPFLHTLIIRFFYSLSTLVLKKDINFGIAMYSVFQILIMAFCFAFALSTLAYAKIPKPVILVTSVIYAFSPYNIALSCAMIKDVMFSGSVLVYICCFYRLLFSVGNHKLNNFLFLISGIGFGLLRSNGWMAMLVTFLFVFIPLFQSYKNILILSAIVLAFTWFCKEPLLNNILHIPQPDILEALSIPEQQIGRVLYDGKKITDEQTALISHVIDPKKVNEHYYVWTSDPLKDEIRRNDFEYMKSHLKEYGKLYVQLGKKYPLEYLKGFTDETKGYWNSGYRYWLYQELVYENDYQIHNAAVFSPDKNHLFDWYYTPAFNWLHAIGLHTWILFYLLVVMHHKKDKKYLLTIPVLMIVGSVIATTPVFTEFRYVYAMFTCLPFLLSIFLFQTKSQEESVSR